MKALQQLIKVKAKAVARSISIPMPKYRKGNHDAATAGIIAGLALLGGSLATTFISSFSELLGDNAKYVTDFLGMIGFVALIGGIVEYKKLRKQILNK
ncbi:MAG: conjugal transfer protein [Thermoprotei archaeon]|nr:conjugal transfer protein [Thermoprotei archaeon]